MKLYLDPNLVLQPSGELPPDPGQVGVLARKRREAKLWMVENLPAQTHPLVLAYAEELECDSKT